jgi:hypothetical protein
MMRENEENSLITQDWICPYVLLIKLMFFIFRSINVWMDGDAHRGPPNHESWKKNIQWPPYWVSTYVHLCLRYRAVSLNYKSQERQQLWSWEITFWSFNFTVFYLKTFVVSKWSGFANCSCGVCKFDCSVILNFPPHSRWYNDNHQFKNSKCLSLQKK